MDVEITPEPTDAERTALAAAVELAALADGERDGSAWWAAGLPAGDDDESEPQATVRLRRSCGAARA